MTQLLLSLFKLACRPPSLKRGLTEYFTDFEMSFADFKTITSAQYTFSVELSEKSLALQPATATPRALWMRSATRTPPSASARRASTAPTAATSARRATSTFPTVHPAPARRWAPGENPFLNEISLVKSINLIN